MRLTFALSAGIAILFGLNWPMTEIFGPAGSMDWQIYQTLFVLSGILSICLMAGSMVLALRLPIFDRWLGGLDHVYAIHRRMAETAIILGLFHYLWRLAMKEMVHAGMMEKTHFAWLKGVDLLRPLHHTMADLAEKAIYVVLLLAAIALLRKVPYHWFARIHIVMSGLFVLLAVHSVVELPAAMWLSPMGMIVALFVAGGTFAAILSIGQSIGKTRQFPAKISGLDRLEDGKAPIFQITLKPSKSWTGHAAGQFLFVTFDKKEGRHPFTIASCHTQQNGDLRLIIKALGDYTSRFFEQLSLGQDVTIEGPYGQFQFKDRATQGQIWVGAGVGVTPFVARLEELAAKGGSTVPVDFYLCAQSYVPKLHDRLKLLAKDAGVKLHILYADQDEYLSASIIANGGHSLASRSVWFCGPESFGNQLQQGLMKLGLRQRRFHREAFDFRGAFIG